MEHRVDLAAAEPHPLGTLLESCNLTLRYRTVGLGYHHEEIQQLQALRVVHLLVDLTATLAHGLFELLPPFALLFVEEAVQYLIALNDGIVAEVLPEHLPHEFHLGVHRLAIGLDDIRSKHKQREEEAVALSLLHTLAISLLVGLIISLISLVPLGACAPGT